MRWFIRLLAAAGALAVSMLSTGALAAPDPSPVAPLSPGERLYLKGLSVNGAPIAATVQGDLRVRSIDMPCANCHRRSGWGTSEGPVTTPPVVGPVLFQPVTRGAAAIGTRTTGAGTRPAYDDESLLRALRDGIDPAGRTLAQTMPRYNVSAADVAALAAHFKSLSAGPPPGVTDSTVHFATIVGPNISAARRDSVLDILRAFVRAKNAGTRHETRRRERGPWDMKEQYQLYRNWVVHEWVLSGSPADWPAQLEELYRKDPVFAILGGVVDDDWSPIDAFAVRHGIPEVLPQTPLPPSNSSDPFYGLYFSRGVAADSEKLARQLRSANPSARVLQVFRCGTAGAAAAAAFAREFPMSLDKRSVCLPADAPVTADAWRERLEDGADIVVSWLDDRDVSALEALASRDDLLAKVKEVYLSSALLGERAVTLPRALASKASLVHPFVAPDEFDQYAWRTLTWFKVNQLTPSDRWLAANTFFAATLAGDALAMPRTLASRELFVERMEHMAARSPQRSAYASVSFDAAHHFGSAAFRTVKLAAPASGSSTKVEQ